MAPHSFLLSRVISVFVLAASASSTALPSFTEFSAPDNVAIYPDNTALHTQAWWVRGAGSNEIPDFASGITVFSKLMTNASTVTFTPLSSLLGMCRLTNFTRDCNNPWAGTGSDMAHPTSVDFAIVSRQDDLTLFQAEDDISVYPVVASAVVIVHGVQGLSAPLVLSRSVLARIFRKCDEDPSTYCAPGEIRYWNDPDILALNPHQTQALTNAGEIRLVVRSDSSGTTRSLHVALEAFDADFAAMMANVTNQNLASWPGMDVNLFEGAEALAGQFINGAFVPPGMANIGYVPLSLVEPLSLQTVGLTQSTRAAAIFPVYDSIVRGLYEKAMNYPIVETAPNGNFFEFISLVDEQNVDAWPIMFTQFLVLRMRGMRPGATCNTRMELLKFVERLYDPYNTLLLDLANTTGMLLMPTAATSVYVQHIRQHLECQGQNVYDMATVAPIYNIVLTVPDGLTVFMESILRRFINEFHSELNYPDAAIGDNPASPRFNYTVVAMNPGTTSMTGMLQEQNATTGIMLTPSWMVPLLKDASDNVIFPWSGVSMVVRVNWCGPNPLTRSADCLGPQYDTVNLSASVVANIFQGTILYWNDTQIQQLNPNIQLPTAAIVPVPPLHGPWREAMGDTLLQASQQLVYEFSTAYFDPQSYEAQLAALYSTQYAITLVAGTTIAAFDADSSSFVAAIDSQGAYPQLDPVLPSVTATLQCAKAPGAFNLDQGTFHFASNTNYVTGCYRLLVTLNWVVRSNQIAACEAGLQSTVIARKGFIGDLVTTPDTAALRLKQLLTWLIQFQQYQSIEYLSAGARFVYENPPNATTLLDPLTLAFHTSSFAAWFNLEKFALTAEEFAVMHELRGVNLNMLSCGNNQALSSTVETLNLIPSGTVYGFGYFMLALSLFICVFLGIWVHCHKHRAVVRLSSPVFLWTILFGGAMCSLAIIPLTMQDDDFNRNIGFTPAQLARLDLACMSIPWLFTLGFVIQFTALFIKTWRLVVIFDNPHMRKFKHLHDSDLLTRMIPLFALVIVINLVWTLVDPLTWDRVPLVISQDGNTVLSSMGLCTVKGNPWTFVGTLMGVLFFVLLVGLRLCYKARALPSDLNESAWISLALMVQFQTLVMAVPVLSLTADNATSSFIFKVVVVFSSSCVTILLLFLPKLWRIHGWGDSGSGSGAGGSAAKADSANKAIKVGKPNKSEKPSSKGSESGRVGTSLWNSMMLGPKGESQDSFLVASVVTAAAEYQQKAGLVKPSSASLDAVTGGALHNKGAQFYEAMKDKALRAILFSRLRKSYRAEGLEFFVCCLERIRIEDPQEKAAATRTIVREFVLNDSKRQVNIGSAERDRLIRACLEEDDAHILSDDFFSAPALDSCKELIASKEFSDFCKEFLKDRNIPESGPKLATVAPVAVPRQGVHAETTSPASDGNKSPGNRGLIAAARSGRTASSSSLTTAKGSPKVQGGDGFKATATEKRVGSSATVALDQSPSSSSSHKFSLKSLLGGSNPGNSATWSDSAQ